MTLARSNKDRGDVRIHESFDELSIDLDDYIAELSETSVKDRGVFAIAISGGSLISLMRNFVELLIIRQLICLSGIYFGPMNAWWRRIMSIAIISLQMIIFCPRVTTS